MAKSAITIAAIIIVFPILLDAQVESAAFKNVANILTQNTTGRVAVLHPGMFIDPIYDSSNREDQLSYVTFYNQMLKLSVIYTPAQHDLAELFSFVLSNAEWATVPLVPAQVQELAQVTHLLYGDSNRTPTKGYAIYLQKKAAYKEIRSKYENTPEAQRTSELENQLQSASDDLDLAGHRAVYEPAETRLKLLSDSKSLQWRTDDTAKVSEATVPSSDGNHWLLTETKPLLDGIDQTNWTKVSFTKTQLSNTDSASSVSGTSAPANPAWWYWAGTTPSNSSCAGHLPAGALSIQFDLLTIPIVRPWFDQQLFESQAWRLPPDAGLFSDGNETGNMGSSPMFATAIIVVRNLAISGDVVASCRSDIRRAVRNQKGVGFGPFKLAGVAVGTDSPYLAASVTSSRIWVPQIQIIAVTSEILPKSPNANPNFQWPIH